MNLPPTHPYFQQLNAYIQWQYRKLQELERQIGELRVELETLKRQRTTTVERIEYKFDQLKIERLEGTLHIGISPDVGKSIEDFTINGSGVEVPGSPTNEETIVNGAAVSEDSNASASDASDMNSTNGFGSAATPNPPFGPKPPDDAGVPRADTPADDESRARVREAVERYLTGECVAHIRELESRYRLVLGDDYRRFMIEDIRAQLDPRIRHYWHAEEKAGLGDRPAREKRVAEKLIADIRAAVERHFQERKPKGDI